MKIKYQFQFSRKALSDFRALSKALRNTIIEKIEFFQRQEDPLKYAIKLSGLENKYRFRIGSYRLICEKDKNNHWVIILILKIAHRKEVYC